MTARLLALAAVLPAVLAGCIGDEESQPPAVCASDSCEGPESCLGLACSLVPAAVNETARPEPEEEAILLDGDVGQGVTVCEFSQDPPCRSVETAQYDGGVLVPINGTILGGTVTLTWTAASELHRELGFGVMTMTPGCGECHRETLNDITGPSPLTIEIPAADFVLQEEEQLHVYAYATTYREVGSVGFEVDGGQPFHVEGNVTYQPWVAPAA